MARLRILQCLRGRATYSNNWGETPPPCIQRTGARCARLAKQPTRIALPTFTASALRKRSTSERTRQSPSKLRAMAHDPARCAGIGNDHAIGIFDASDIARYPRQAGAGGPQARPRQRGSRFRRNISPVTKSWLPAMTASPRLGRSQCGFGLGPLARSIRPERHKFRAPAKMTGTSDQTPHFQRLGETTVTSPPPRSSTKVAGR